MALHMTYIQTCKAFSKSGRLVMCFDITASVELQTPISACVGNRSSNEGATSKIWPLVLNPRPSDGGVWWHS